MLLYCFLTESRWFTGLYRNRFRLVRYSWTAVIFCFRVTLVCVCACVCTCGLVWWWWWWWWWCVCVCVCVCVCRCRQGSVLLCHRDEPAVPAARRVHTGPGRDGNLLRVPVWRPTRHGLLWNPAVGSQCSHFCQKKKKKKPQKKHGWIKRQFLFVMPYFGTTTKSRGF